MGWQHLEFTRSDGSKFVMFMPREDANQPYIKQHNPDVVISGGEDNAPNYTTDANDSMMLRRRLMRAYSAMEMRWKDGRVSVRVCSRFCIEPNKGHHDFDYYVEASTEELAVALCALQSVWIEVNEDEILFGAR
jgi:hypothetical protein